MVVKKKPAAKKPIPKKPVAKKKAAPHPAVENEVTEEEAPEEEAPETEEAPAGDEFKLPRGINQEEYDTAKTIITSGFENGAEPDQIKGAMFEGGIVFGKLERLFKLITISERLVIPVKEVRENVAAWLGENEPDIEALAASYGTVEQLVKHLMDEVEGATTRVLFAAIKKWLEEAGYEMPKKPKGMGRTSGVAKAIVNAFAANTELTFEEYKEVLEPLCTEKSINRWLGLYKPFALIAANEPFPA